MSTVDHGGSDGVEEDNSNTSTASTADKAPGPLNPFDPSHLPLPSTTPLSSFLAHPFQPGRVYYSACRSVEYTVGSLPLIISVPHGGHRYSALPSSSSSPASSASSPASSPSFAPSSTLPDRLTGCHEKDLNSQELGRALFAALCRLFPSRCPHLIVSRIHRRKVDFNRSRDDCSEVEEGRRVWDDYQRCIMRAKLSITSTQPTIRVADPPSSSTPFHPSSSIHRWLDGQVGLFVDLHGQRHDTRCQIGYLLNKEDLVSLDSSLPSSSPPPPPSFSSPPSSVADKLSVHHLWRHSVLHPSFTDILRGQYSLGHLLEQRGYPCIPSPTSPSPSPSPVYFNGGHNTARHGSAPLSQRKKQERTEQEKNKGQEGREDDQVEVTLVGSGVSSLQIETAYEEIRSTASHRQQFATALADALVAFMDWHAPSTGEEGGGAGGVDGPAALQQAGVGVN